MIKEYCDPYVTYARRAKNENIKNSLNRSTIVSPDKNDSSSCYRNSTEDFDLKNNMNPSCRSNTKIGYQSMVDQSDYNYLCSNLNSSVIHRKSVIVSDSDSNVSIQDDNGSYDSGDKCSNLTGSSNSIIDISDNKLHITNSASKIMKSIIYEDPINASKCQSSSSSSSKLNVSKHQMNKLKQSPLLTRQVFHKLRTQYDSEHNSYLSKLNISPSTHRISKGKAITSYKSENDHHYTHGVNNAVPVRHHSQSNKLFGSSAENNLHYINDDRNRNLFYYENCISLDPEGFLADESTVSRLADDHSLHTLGTDPSLEIFSPDTTVTASDMLSSGTPFHCLLQSVDRDTLRDFSGGREPVVASYLENHLMTQKQQQQQRQHPSHMHTRNKLSEIQPLNEKHMPNHPYQGKYECDGSDANSANINIHIVSPSVSASSGAHKELKFGSCHTRLMLSPAAHGGSGSGAGSDSSYDLLCQESAKVVSVDTSDLSTSASSFLTLNEVESLTYYLQMLLTVLLLFFVVVFVDSTLSRYPLYPLSSELSGGLLYGSDSSTGSGRSSVSYSSLRHSSSQHHRQQQQQQQAGYKSSHTATGASVVMPSRRNRVYSIQDIIAPFEADRHLHTRSSSSTSASTSTSASATYHRHPYVGSSVDAPPSAGHSSGRYYEGEDEESVTVTVDLEALVVMSSPQYKLSQSKLMLFPSSHAQRYPLIVKTMSAGVRGHLNTCYAAHAFAASAAAAVDVSASVTERVKTSLRQSHSHSHSSESRGDYAKSLVSSYMTMSRYLKPAFFQPAVCTPHHEKVYNSARMRVTCLLHAASMTRNPLALTLDAQRQQHMVIISS